MPDICEMSATEIAAAVGQGTLSAREVAQAHLARIDAVNPAINAVVDMRPEEVLKSADAVDAARARGDAPGALCGVPVTVKVNTDQAGFATTNGLRAQKDLIAAVDSPVVANLRRAGAVIVGRTNTPAFSLRWFTKNALHGQTLNPRNPALTPGGSSGGAGAAVAAGLCAVGHGTDIAGSIRYPAYACGIHGLRPTVGRVPAYNATAPDRFIGAQIMAVSGPLARSIDDIALSLAAMAAPDPRDPGHVPCALESGAFERRAVLCVAPDGMPVVPEVARALQDAADKLRDAGWRVDEAPCPPVRAAARINAQLWMAETQFSARAAMATEADPDALFVLEQMQQDAGAIDFDVVMEALRARAGIMRAWGTFFEDTPLLLCPVSGALPFDQQQDVVSPAGFADVLEAQLLQRGLPALGMPALSVATEAVEAHPMGVQLVAARFREDILLTAGRDFEARSAPVTLATPTRA